jgi:membrane fusion protein (multidrug efflux system)
MKLETVPSLVQNDGSQNHAGLFPRMLCLALAAMVVSTASAQPKPGGMPEVTTVTVSRQPVTLTTELPGRTTPYLIAEIRPQVNGLIQKRLFVEGSDVKAGQELYQIDPAPFQAALDNANAALSRAEVRLPATQSRADRFKQALAEKAVSQQDYDDADSALKQAVADIQFYKAAVTTARINLDYAHIVSPISGRIGKSTVTDGAIVTAYQPAPLATIQQLDPIYVDVPQSTVQLLRLRQRLSANQIRGGTDENKVKLLLEDGTPYPLAGTLQFRDVSVDPTTGSVILRAVFPNTNNVLLPGMFVRAIVKEGVNDQAILVPQQTVSRDSKGNPFVLIVNAESKVEQRFIQVDRALGDQWLVTSGLEPGEKIVMEGQQKARPGTQVIAQPFGAAKPAPTQPAPASK